VCDLGGGLLWGATLSDGMGDRRRHAPSVSDHERVLPATLVVYDPIFDDSFDVSLDCVSLNLDE
jgi:hypothetical protein